MSTARAGAIRTAIVTAAVCAAASAQNLPAPKNTWLAQRLNTRQVVIYLLAAEPPCGASGPPLPSAHGPNRLGGLQAVRPADVAPFMACVARQRLPPPYPPPAGLHLGQRFLLLLGGDARVRLRLTGFAAANGGLENDLLGVATLAPRGLAAFQQSPRDDFLAQAEGRTGADDGSARVALVTPRLDAAQHAALAAKLNLILQAALPQWRAIEAEYLRSEHWTRLHQHMVQFWRTMDAGLAAGHGQLRFDVQAVHLGPGPGREVYRVRAVWRIAGQAAGLLTAWIRPGPRLDLIHVDAWPGKLLRVPEMFPRGAPVRKARGYCGHILNAFWLAPGRTGILVFDTGYEDISETLLLWRPSGPVATNLGWADGG